MEKPVNVVSKGDDCPLLPRRAGGHLDFHFAQLQVFGGKIALALVDFKPQTPLVVVEGVEPLLAAGGQHTAPGDQHGHMGGAVVPAAVGGYAQGEGAHVCHNQVLEVLGALLDARAESHAQGHDFIRGGGDVGPAAKEAFQEIHKDRQLGGAAHQDHVVEPSAPVPVLHGPGDDGPDLLEHRPAELAQQVVGE